MGLVRAAISLVTVCNGLKNTTSAQNRMEKIVPTARLRADSRIQWKSPMAMAKPSPMIGPISGESSIAPITTAGEDSSSPRMAMPADMVIISR